MEEIKIYYDDVSKVVFDANGKEYPIKEYNRSKCIHFNDKRIAISKLPKKIRIRNFDDVVFNYVFNGWNQKYPCPAIEILVNKKINNEKRKKRKKRQKRQTNFNQKYN